MIKTVVNLTELKIEQLLNYADPNKITINGDPGQGELIAKKYKVNFVKRSPELTASSLIISVRDDWR